MGNSKGSNTRVEGGAQEFKMLWLKYYSKTLL